jgi:hypothetical protein
MKYFYAYIFLLICFIVGMSYYNTYTYTYNHAIQEFFNNNNDKNKNNKNKKETLVLLGDSILKNNSYMDYNEKSVEHLLKEKSNNNCFNYAEDGAIIIDCYDQLDKIPDDLNNKRTTIYLSVGGNDIIKHYIEGLKNTKDTHVLNTMFDSYTELVKSIQTRMNLSKIVLLDIYYPSEPYYKKYYGIINKWNKKIYDFASNPQNKIYGVLKVSKILNNQNDFVFDIEPSATGGEKIVNLIINK